jgi:hypothetical protein
MTVMNNIIVEPLFPNLLISKEIDEFQNIKKDLVNWIYQYQNKEDPSGVNYTNCGGYQSKHDIFDKKSFKRYLNIIHKEVNTCLSAVLKDNYFEIVEGWVNINKKGNFNRTHNHPQVDLAAVLWVSVEDIKSGIIEFENPLTFQEYTFLSKLKPNVVDDTFATKTRGIYPKDGLMLIFPSHIDHLVQPNQLDSDRISISFNISLIPHYLVKK